MNPEYMRRAIELAKGGIGYTNPNPLVGAVIVKNNKIIGEGFHEKYGSNHAEVNALKNAKEDVEGADMYVTLEPCSHYGKTPPCVDAIIKNKLSRVIIGMQDPNPIVSGNGIDKLRKNGIEVITNVLEEEIKELNNIFIKYITAHKPYCLMKTAMTLDGKIATASGDSKWISNTSSRAYVHKLRHRFSAIMVGVGTVLADDPLLNTRLEDKKGVDPIKVIVDTHCKIPQNARLLTSSSRAKIIIATTQMADNKKVSQLEEKGAKILITPIKNGKVDLQELMKSLGDLGIDSVLLEGGGTLNYSALETGIVDEVITFIAPKIIGGDNAKTPVEGIGRDLMKNAFNLKDIKILRFDEDIMIQGKIIH